MSAASQRTTGLALLHTQRAILIVLGLVSILLAVPRTAILAAQGDEPAWLVAVSLASQAAPIAAAIIAPWARRRRSMRVLATISVSTQLLALVVVLGACLTAVVEVPTSLPWSMTFLGLMSAAALVAGGPVFATAVLSIGTILVTGIRVVTGQDLWASVANDAHAFFVSIAVILLGSILFTAQRTLDEAEAAAAARARVKAAAQAARTAHQDAAAFVHDDVLALLSLAGRGTPTLAPALSVEADRVAHSRAQLVRGASGPETTARDVVLRVRHLCEELDPAAEVETVVYEPIAGDAVPIDVADALYGAVRQALVNSMTHAGAQARRRVQLRAGDSGVVIVVDDDGRGFDPASPAEGRLGIEVGMVGRMASVPGGWSSVDAAPGRGATITVGWHPPSAAPEHSRAAPRPRRTEAAVALVIAVFCVMQTGLAVVAAIRLGDVWPHALALVGLLLAIGVLRPTAPQRPGLARSILTIGILVLTAAVALLPAARDPERYGDTWFVAATGFALAMLALRGRSALAALGALAVAAVSLIAAASGVDPADSLASLLRATLLVVVGIAFTLLLRRVHARLGAVRRRERADANAIAAHQAAEATIDAQLAELDRLLAPMLGRLRTGAPLDDAERRECLALEGRMRDRYRAPRLFAEPLVSAAMRARRRGIEVVLLDDSRGGESPLDEVVAWMADILDGAESGRFTGRLLPPRREALASVVRGEETTLFRG